MILLPAVVPLSNYQSLLPPVLLFLLLNLYLLFITEASHLLLHVRTVFSPFRKLYVNRGSRIYCKMHITANGEKLLFKVNDQGAIIILNSSSRMFRIWKLILILRKRYCQSRNVGRLLIWRLTIVFPIEMY